MRVKRGLHKKQKHKKVLKQARGYQLTRSKLYRRAVQSLLHSGQYNFAHRRKRPNQFRKNWIGMINAACRKYDLSYSKFISNLQAANVVLDRKILAYLAFNNEPAFAKLVAATRK